METQVFNNWRSLVEAVTVYEESGYNVFYDYISYNGFHYEGAIIRNFGTKIIAYLIYSPELYENTEYKHRY